MAPADSWWLKFARAQKHMIEIKQEAVRYARRHPYRFVDLSKPTGKIEIRHSVEITSQPGSDLSLIFGDFVHNLRSALDHIIVASIDKKERSNATSFPFVSADPWAKKPDGNFVVEKPDVRENFDRCLAGLDENARAIVIANQPYRHRKRRVPWLLGMISQFDNADKHRDLIVTGGGIRRVRAEISIAGVYQGIVTQHFDNREYAKDGTILGLSLPPSFAHPMAPGASEVEVKYRGVAVILIRVNEDGGKGQSLEFDLYPTVRDCLGETRRMLRLLEPFAIYK